MIPIINCIQIQNFKVYKDIHSIPLAPITLIYGPNSGGKSTILQSLQLLKQTMGDAGSKPVELMPTGNLVDLGNFRSLIFKHDVKRHLGLELAFSPRVSYYKGLSSSFLDLFRTVGLSFKTLNTKEHDVRACVSNVKFGMYLPGQQKSGFSIELQLKGKDIFEFHSENSRIALANFISQYSGIEKNALESILPFAKMQCEHGLPSGFLVPPRLEMNSRSIDTIIKLKEIDILGSISKEFMDTLSSISYLGPLRSQPTRQYVSVGGRVKSVGLQGEMMAQLLLDNSKNILPILNSEFANFDIPYRMTLRRHQDDIMGTIIVLALLDARTNVQVSPVDVGFGIGQLLPIIVEGLVSKRNVICVEQPEIHLHPRLQAHMADYFIKTAGIGKDPICQNQWIIETHSEALMLRMQRRIREHAINANDISVLYIQSGKINESGSEIIQLTLDEQGCFIKDWPDGFFEESYNEIFQEVHV